MAPEYIISPESDFSSGIDARSAENQISPSFVEDLLNADIVEKRARKRTGRQGFAGNLPVRVTQLEYIASSNEMYLTLDSAVSLDEAVVDLGAVRSSPLVIYGRSSSISSGGPIVSTADSRHYYTGFSIPTRKTFQASSSIETLLVSETEHGISTTDMYVGVVESTSSTDRSYSVALPHTIDVSESTADLTISYENGTGTDSPVYVFYKDQAAVAGDNYIATLSHSGGGSQTFSISAATHALNNFNILAMVQQDNGTSRQFVNPTQLSITAAGDVSVTLVSEDAASFILILQAAPIANVVSGNVLGGGSQSTITIPDVSSPWLFIGIYIETTPGGDIEWVIPDSVTYDDATATALVTFTNNSAAAANAAIYWDTGIVRSNQLAIVDAGISVDATDTAPQLTIWGLDHTEIYGPNKASRSGWLNHIDSYKAPGERRLVAGLGGNLFTARTYAEAGSDYGFAQLYPRLQNRTASAKRLGPLFYETGDAPARTRGYITGDDSGTNWVRVTAVQWDASTSSTIYTLLVPGLGIWDASGAPTSLSSVISTTTDLEDYLTIQGMGAARHNGTFKILQATQAGGLDSLLLRVDNSNNASDYDDDGVQGQAGVFTDQIDWLADAAFIQDDILSNAATPSAILKAVSSSGMTTVVTGFTDLMQMAGGLATTGQRTSRVVPLRDPAPGAAASVTNLVRGDMLEFTAASDSRLLRVLSLNPNADLQADLTDDGNGLITCQLASGSTVSLREGMSVLLVQAGLYSGAQTILSITGDTTFTFEATSNGDVEGVTLAGQTCELDEELEWKDATDESQVFTVQRRWIPVEAPDDSWGLTPSTHVRYFDTDSYGDQSFLRSTMVMNNLYLTNSRDEVLKFDGQSNYRAGLIPWQLGLFLTQDTGASAKIVVSARSISYSAVSTAGGYLTIDSNDALVLPVGSSVRFSGSSESYTVRGYQQNATTATTTYLQVDRALDASVSSTGTASEVLTRRYYFRLNAVDVNSNVVASAVTGSQDHVVELAGDAAVQLKGIGLPAWDIYDYDRLEVEIYGTKLGTSAPFYKLTTEQLNFDNQLGYFTFTDVFSDEDLIDLDATISGGLGFGAELPIGLQEPLRAKSITSLGNSLVLANLRDYPQIDLQLVANGAIDNSVFGGKKFLFLRDSTDLGSGTSMPSRACYELVDGVTGTTSAFTIGTDQFSFTTSSATGAAEGDWIYLTYGTVATTGRDLSYSGWWQIQGVSGTSVTVNLSGAAAADSYPDSYVIATDPTDIPVLLGTDGNLGMVNGDSFDLFDTMRRMSSAINASMRQVDVSLTGMPGFTPWLTARGGNDVARAGRLIVRQPRSDVSTFAVKLPSSFGTAPSDFQVFVNDIRRAVSTTVASQVRVYPSRLLVSFENYPEMFDNPTVVLDSESKSTIDVNSADGQEITGVIPFFGQTAFTAAQQTTVLVAFKSNSIYLVDVNEKRAGRNPVQRIETEGLGCTAPYSIAVTKKGVIFCNESGIYCLRRDLTIEYIGRFMERNWVERVNLDALEITQGHHYGIGRCYKVSVPIGLDTEASEVYVYNHTGEDLQTSKTGAWGRYDSHSSTGWANLDADAFEATTSGRVFSLRRQGTSTDYRDDNLPITFRLRTRALDFGNAGIRKVLDRIVAKYRSLTRNLATRLGISVDLSSEYRDTTPLTIPGSTNAELQGISDSTSQQIFPVLHTTDRRRGVYFGIEVVNDGLDEGIEVAGLDCRIGGLSTKGIATAASSARK